jgi:V/A-type H+-transporting ATPase subunit I
MAIVKMKKLRVMAMASDREELLHRLLHLGCVEISEPDDKLADPQWSALLRRGPSRLAEKKDEITDVSTALDAIKKYGQLKEGLFIQRHPISEKEFLSAETAQRAQEAAKKVGGLLETLSRLQSEEGRMNARCASLEPWKALDMPLEIRDTAHVLFRMGVCPGATDIGAVRTELDACGAAAELIDAYSDRQQRYLLLICHRADEEKAMDVLRPRSFSVVSFQGFTGTPADNLRELEEQIGENRRQQKQTLQAITACAEYRGALRVYADRLNAEAMRETDAERLLTDGTIVFFEGWAPAEAMDQVEALFREKGCAWDASDPTPEEYPDVPVKLKNNWFTRQLNMVTEMYSLPAYDGVDPNPLMAPFFILFYGFMMADMGYGALMVLFSVLVTKKYKPKGTAGHLFRLMGMCGVSAFIFGVVTGGFFGDFIPQIAMILNPNTTLTELPSLFTPLNDTLSILIGAMCLGAVQIITGMAISFVEKLKRHEYMDAISGKRSPGGSCFWASRCWP